MLHFSGSMEVQPHVHASWLFILCKCRIWLYTSAACHSLSAHQDDTASMEQSSRASPWMALCCAAGPSDLLLRLCSAPCSMAAVVCTLRIGAIICRVSSCAWRHKKPLSLEVSKESMLTQLIVSSLSPDEMALHQVRVQTSSWSNMGQSGPCSRTR